MALPSSGRSLAFAGGGAGTMIGFRGGNGEAMLGNDPGETVGALLIGGIALVTAGATWLHWRRFMVLITVAAGTAALAATAVALILSLTRSEERRVGKEWVSKWSCGGSPDS